LICERRSSVHGSLQTASTADKPSLERQLALIDRDIETTDKEITRMSFLMPEACITAGFNVISAIFSTCIDTLAYRKFIACTKFGIWGENIIVDKKDKQSIKRINRLRLLIVGAVRNCQIGGW